MGENTYGRFFLTIYDNFGRQHAIVSIGLQLGIGWMQKRY